MCEMVLPGAIFMSSFMYVATNLNTTAPEKQKSPWFRVAQVLLLATFVVAVYLLGLSMVHHRFFKGSRVDQYGHVRQ